MSSAKEAGSAQILVVSARWDGEARVWVAESDDVPGLVTEAATLEALATKLASLVPELLELNAHLLPGIASRPAAIELTARQHVPLIA